MPYLVMIDRLRSFLRDSDGPVAMFLLGYSFSDQHLNEVLFDGLQANQNAACFAVQYGKIENYAHAIELARQIPNMIIIAENSGLIRGKSAPWMMRKPGDSSALSIAFVAEEEIDSKKEAVDSSEDVAIRFNCALGNFASFAKLLDEFTLIGDS